MRNTNILKFKKMSHDDLNEVITKSVNDFNLWVIIEALEDTSEYKLYFIEEGVNWCSISGVGTVSNDKIKECYENVGFPFLVNFKNRQFFLLKTFFSFLFFKL